MRCSDRNAEFDSVRVMPVDHLPDCHWCRIHGGIHEPAVGSVQVGARHGRFSEHMPACEGHLHLEWRGGTVVRYRLEGSN